MTNPNEVFPAKDANEEEDGRDEPGQDDHHDHLVDRDDDYEDNGHDKDLVSCAPCSIPGGQLHRTKPEKGNPKSIWDFRERRTNKRSRVTEYVVNSLVLIS